MRNLQLTILILLLFFTNANATCTIVRDDMQCTIGEDLNFITNTTHDGVASQNFDLNISILRPNGLWYTQDTAMNPLVSASSIWYYEIVAGLNTVGNYLAIFDLEHEIGGVGDGNFSQEVWKLEIIDKNLHQQILDSASDLNTNISNVYSDLNSEINEIDDSNSAEFADAVWASNNAINVSDIAVEVWESELVKTGKTGGIRIVYTPPSKDNGFFAILSNGTNELMSLLSVELFSFGLGDYPISVSNGFAWFGLISMSIIVVRRVKK